MQRQLEVSIRQQYTLHKQNQYCRSSTALPKLSALIHQHSYHNLSMRVWMNAKNHQRQGGGRSSSHDILRGNRNLDDAVRWQGARYDVRQSRPSHEAPRGRGHSHLQVSARFGAWRHICPVEKCSAGGGTGAGAREGAGTILQYHTPFSQSPITLSQIRG